MNQKPEKREFDLEERLLDFSARIINVTESLKPTRAGNHVADQLLRAGTSPYANHGEAEGAESPNDFIHKLKVCYKELRESRRRLRLIQRSNLIEKPALLAPLIGESDELIRIFYASIRTAKANKNIQRSNKTPPASDIDLNVER